MSETVSEQLEDTKTGLARRLYQNHEVCGVLAALLGKVVIECSHRGTGIENVKLGTLRASGDGSFTARVDYYHTGFAVPAGFGEKGTFEDYLAHKGIQLAKVLVLNHSMSVLFESLIERLDQYAIHKGVQFSDLWVYDEGAFISKDDELVIRVGYGEKPYRLQELR